MTAQLHDPLTYENLMLGLIMRFEQQPAVTLDSEDATGNGGEDKSVLQRKALIPG